MTSTQQHSDQSCKDDHEHNHDHTHEQEEQITSTSSTSNKKRKRGRRSDPRMDRAVDARTRDPSLSLLDALIIGGFPVTRKSDEAGNPVSSSQQQEDATTLMQRKNQLSRRLRQARLAQTKNPPPLPAPQCSDGSNGNGLHIVSSENGIVDFVEKEEENEEDEEFQNKKRAVSAESTLDENGAIATDNSAHSVKYEDFAITTNNQFASAFNNHDASTGVTMNNHISQMPSPPTSTIYTPHSIQQTHTSIQQLHHSIQQLHNSSVQERTKPNNPQHQQFSNVQPPSPTSDPSSGIQYSIKTNRNIDSHETKTKMKAALNSFIVKSTSQMKRSMLEAGFNIDETEECDDMYLLFMRKILEVENRRYNRIRKRCRDANMYNSNNNYGTTDGGNYALQQQQPQHNINNINGGTCTFVGPNNGTLNTIGDENRSVHPGDNTTTHSAKENTTMYSKIGSDNYNTNGPNLKIPPPSISVSSTTITPTPSSEKRKSGTVDGALKMDFANGKKKQPNGGCVCDDTPRHVHRLQGKCGHKAIIHKPKNGAVHVDFVVDGKVECYQHFHNSMSRVREQAWPSTFKEQDWSDGNSISSNNSAKQKTALAKCGKEGCRNLDRMVFDLSDINIDQSEEWNLLEYNDEGSLAGLLKLGGSTDDADAKPESAPNFHRRKDP